MALIKDFATYALNVNTFTKMNVLRGPDFTWHSGSGTVGLIAGDLLVGVRKTINDYISLELVYCSTGSYTASTNTGYYFAVRGVTSPDAWGTYEDDEVADSLVVLNSSGTLKLSSFFVQADHVDSTVFPNLFA